MFALVIAFVLLGLSSIVFYFTGWLDVGIKYIFRLVRHRDRKIRLEQRPSRIFLIRHGESQANVDKSKRSFSIKSI